MERARRAMRVFFLVRGVCMAMRGERDAQLPLTRPSACVRVHDVLDLSERAYGLDRDTDSTTLEKRSL